MSVQRFIVTGMGAFALTSAAQAGFIVSEARTSVSATLDRVDLLAFNTGGETGTKFNGVYFEALYTLGGKSYWSVDDTDEDGVPDTLDVFNAQSRPNTSYVRPIPVQSSTFNYGPMPVGEYRQPNPWTSGVHGFSLFSAGLGVGSIANTGAGYRFARLFVDRGARIVAEGKVGGDVGAMVPFGLNLGTTGTAPTITVTGPRSNSYYVFDLRKSSNFDWTVSAFDADGDALNVLMTVPNNRFFDNLSVTEAPAATKVFHFTNLGLSDIQDPGTLWGFQFTAIDSAGNVSVKEINAFVIAPEPTGMAVAAALSWAGRRRRRQVAV